MKVKELIKVLDNKEQWGYVLNRNEQDFKDQVGETHNLQDLTEEMLEEVFIRFNVLSEEGNPFMKPTVFFLIPQNNQ